MPLAQNAVFHTSNINTDQKVRDVSSAIGFLSPKIAQVLLLSSRVAPAPLNNALGMAEQGAYNLTLGVRTVTNFKFEWFEDAVKSSSTQINNGGGYNSAATSLVVDDSSIFAVNDIVQVVATGELVMITANNTGTNTLTVTRGWGTTAAASIADDAVMLIVGNAFSEAGGYQLSPARLDVTKYNVIQDTRHAFGGTWTLERHELYNGSQRSWLRNKYLVQHQIDIERSLLFGQLKEGTSALSDASPKRSTQGLLDRLTSNVTAVGGALTKQVWNNWLRDVFTYGSPEKVVFCSPTVAGAVNNFAGDANGAAPTSQIFVMNNARQFGLNIMTYQTKFGTVHLVMHGLLTGSVYSGYAVAVDPEKMQLAKVRGGFFMNLREDIKTDGSHTWTDEYCTYFGLQYTNPETGGVLTGVTG